MSMISMLIAAVVVMVVVVAKDHGCDKFLKEHNCFGPDCLKCVHRHRNELPASCPAGLARKKCADGPTPPAPPPPPGPPQGAVPNIILVLTDDQDLLLGSLDLMPATKQHLVSGGVSASNHFTSTPVCCPSRSSILTGRFPHNYPQGSHKAPSGSFETQTACLNPANDDLAVFPLLYKAGYRVGLFGKHMNEAGMGPYCPSNKQSHGIMPKGITSYLGMCPDTCYQDCVFASGKEAGGQTSWVQPTEHQGYGTAIIGNATLDFIRESVADKKPFMVYVAPHAPHLPATPAPWYTDAPVDRGAPRHPSV